MAWKSIDIICQDDTCGHWWGEIVDKADQDNTFICPKCKGPAHRTIRTINQLRHSYPDGHYRMDGMGKALELDRLENAFEQAKDDGNAGFAEAIAEEYVHKKEEK